MHGGSRNQSFQVSVTASTGASFDQIPIAAGTKAWHDSDHTLSEIPAYLEGGSLLRGPHRGLAAGTELSIAVDGVDARIYVAAEVSRNAKAELAAGGLARALGSHRRWTAEQSAPMWGDNNTEMAMFSTIVQRGTILLVPAIPDAETAVLLMAVPIVTGSFAVAVLSSAGTSQERLAVVEEGVQAWKDRDHRYVDVPPSLLGGVLYQGPYKDVPDGTITSVRPNLRSRVYVVTERACSGGFLESLPAEGWMLEEGAPRWHESPTMVMFAKDCAAGTTLVLPPTRGAGAVFSVIVVPTRTPLVAPVEVSVASSDGTEAPLLDLVPLAEGSLAWHDDSRRLTKVPEWMCGAALVQGSHSGPPSGSVVAVRAAAPSVVYAVLDETAGGSRPSGSVVAMPHALLAAGWERRDAAPECEGHSFATFAKRIPARGVVALPTFTAQTGCSEGLLIVVKVDSEAFDATVETSTGLEYSSVKMAETVVAWCDRNNRYAWVPNAMLDGMLFRGPHNTTPSGTTLRIRGTGAFRAYVVVEADYKVRPDAKNRTELSYSGPARTGGFLTTLPEAGWRAEPESPSWGDICSTMKIFSKRCHEGCELMLPPTIGEVIFSVVVVGIANNPEKVIEEIKTSFRAWDPQGKGAILKEDLEGLLRAVCPGLEEEHLSALLADADREHTGRVSYEEFANSLLLVS